jgi:hypothetical protein
MNGEKEQVEIAQVLRRYRENMPALMEFQRLKAQLTREKFNALVRAGFTEEQALKLCQGDDNGS